MCECCGSYRNGLAAAHLGELLATNRSLLAEAAEAEAEGTSWRRQSKASPTTGGGAQGGGGALRGDTRSAEGELVYAETMLRGHANAAADLTEAEGGAANAGQRVRCRARMTKMDGAPDSRGNPPLVVITTKRKRKLQGCM